MLTPLGLPYCCVLSPSPLGSESSLTKVGKLAFTWQGMLNLPMTVKMLFYNYLGAGCTFLDASFYSAKICWDHFAGERAGVLRLCSHSIFFSLQSGFNFGGIFSNVFLQYIPLPAAKQRHCVHWGLCQHTGVFFSCLFPGKEHHDIHSECSRRDKVQDQALDLDANIFGS